MPPASRAKAGVAIARVSDRAVAPRKPSFAIAFLHEVTESNIGAGPSFLYFEAISKL
jgi:hypothetical protein